MELLLLTYRDVADLLRVSERTVWTLVKEGKLKACRIGRLVRVREEAVQEYLQVASIR